MILTVTQHVLAAEFPDVVGRKIGEVSCKIADAIIAEKPLRETRSQQFYRGITVGEDVAYAHDQVQRGNVVSDEQVKLLRRYDPDALASTPYDK
jgi:hypothetical protein